MAFSRGWHPLAIDVISTSMATDREEGRVGISPSLAASCFKDMSPVRCCALMGCPCTVPGAFHAQGRPPVPPLPFPSVLPSSPLGRGRDITPPAGRRFEVGSIICVGNTPRPCCCWGWQGNHRSPTKSWTLVQPAPNLPLLFLPSARVVGSFLGCRPMWPQHP